MERGRLSGDWIDGERMSGDEEGVRPCGSQIYTELGGDKGGHSLQLIRNPPAL